VSPEFLLLLAIGVFAIAVLYSSVGHAGASGYIAWMSLLSLAPSSIRPTALALNILVASIATWQFTRAGHCRRRFKSEPPRRPNIEPGVEADVEMVGCG
jgi:uncharacterized protein